VTSARPDAVAEASFFAEKLLEREVRPAALVVNKIHPSFGDSRGPETALPAAFAPFEENLATMRAIAAREKDAYAGLAQQVLPAPVGRIPLFGHDVHELSALQLTADHLFA
jgi:hypothetical protein